MKTINGILYLFPFFILILGMADPLRGLKSTTESDEPIPVDSVRLDKYAGLWYEIAKIPNRFQRKCAGNTTAQYTLREDGRIDVVNRCAREDGKIIEAKGIAKIVDTRSNAKLKVSFVRFVGISLFWGDYWIVGLDKDYRYAVVGTPSREYGWILSRTPQMSPDDWDAVNEILQNQGYDPGLFEKTSHDNVQSDNVDEHRVEMMEEIGMEPKIIDLDGFAVSGMLNRISPEKESTESYRMIWEAFETYHDQIKPHSTDMAYYGVSFTAGEEGVIDYIAGMAVKDDYAVSEGLAMRRIPAARFAVFECPVDAIGETYKRIFGEWLPKSPYGFNGSAPAFEQYPPEGEDPSPVHIYIPIQDK